MLGLILIYFIGKYFYDLAKSFKKSAILYAVIGVASYYAGVFIGGALIGVVLTYTASDPESINEFVLGLMCIPIGLLSCWGLHRFLKHQWSSKTVVSRDLLDEGFIDQGPTAT